jgi:AraC-like DNA-binding protein
MGQVKLNYRLDMTKDSIWLTATPSQTAKSSIVFVQELGDFISGRDYFTRRENLPSYLIKYTISGEGLLDYDGHSYVVKPGSIFWIDCMKPQYYRTSPRKGEWRVLWVHFYGATCEAYYNMFISQNDGSNVVNLDSDVTVKSTLDTLIGLYRNGDNNLITDIQASGFLTLLMMRCISAAVDQKESSNLPDSVLDARSYINFHYAERVTLNDLAVHLSMNKFYLQKLFKRYMGISPNEYLIQTRLTHAKQTLRTTHRPINQISMDVGINNIGHFINLFKQHEGITPSAYRQRWYLGNKDTEPEQ